MMTRVVKRSLLVLGVLAGILFAIAVGVGQLCMWKVFKVPQNGMAPFINAGDRIFCERFSLLSRAPRRGEVVTFTTEGLRDVLKPGAAPVVFVQRVVGLPGDQLELVDGALTINGRPASDHFDCGGIHYVLPRYAQNSRAVDISKPYTVPEAHVVVFGDNSANSFDSRYWGPLPLANLRHLYWGQIK